LPLHTCYAYKAVEHLSFEITQALDAWDLNARICDRRDAPSRHPTSTARFQNAKLSGRHVKAVSVEIAYSALNFKF